MIDSTNREYAAIWFESIASRAEHLATGNVTHEGPSIKGLAIRSKWFLEQHGHKDDKFLAKLCSRFTELAEFCDNITVFNVLTKKEQIKYYATWCKWYIRRHQFEENPHEMK